MKNIILVEVDEENDFNELMLEVKEDGKLEYTRDFPFELHFSNPFDEMYEYISSIAFSSRIIHARGVVEKCIYKIKDDNDNISKYTVEYIYSKYGCLKGKELFKNGQLIRRFVYDTDKKGDIDTIHMDIIPISKCMDDLDNEYMVFKVNNQGRKLSWN